MTQRHRAAVDVHLFPIELEIADEFLGDHGKRLVDFPHVDVVSGQPGFTQYFFAAGTGAFNIKVGQSPMFAVATMRARGVSPFSSAYCSEVSSNAAAPSTTPDEFPAW